MLKYQFNNYVVVKLVLAFRIFLVMDSSNKYPFIELFQTLDFVDIPDIPAHSPLFCVFIVRDSVPRVGMLRALVSLFQVISTAA